ncbi:MAG: tyrosine-type recombinase/integrase [Chloroflexota bacterium]|nr:tyrosine-type recombinase/integrase [Chloroflexota bacterium]
MRLVFQGIRRTLGSAPAQKNAAITAEVRAMVETLAPTLLIGVRDRALLLVGFAGAFPPQRAGLARRRRRDLLTVRAWSSSCAVRRRTRKARAARSGCRSARTRYLPSAALRAWLDGAAFASGPIFRSVDRHGNGSPLRLTDQSVALIVKRCARTAGLDWESYAGHSLRSGLATAAAMADVSERAIIAQTGHKSLPMVKRYIRDGSLFRRNAAATVGL